MRLNIAKLAEYLTNRGEIYNVQILNSKPDKSKENYDTNDEAITLLVALKYPNLDP